MMEMYQAGVSGHAMSHSSLAHILQDREASLDLWLTLLDCVVERVGGEGREVLRGLNYWAVHKLCI